LIRRSEKSGGKALQDQAKGLLFGLAGYALLSVGDGVAKSMSGEWPGTAIATLRYVASVIGLFAIIWWRQGRAGFTMPRPWLHVGRGASVATGSVCFFVGLHYLPLPDATVIQFTNPLITALLSAFVLGEAASRRVWIATFIAFCGVVLVLRPNVLSLGPAALLPLVTAFCMAVMMILNRMVAGMASVLVMQFLISLTALPFLLGMMIAGHVSGMEVLAVTMPSASVIARCLLIAVTATLAQALIYKATVHVSAAMIAPTTYIQLLVAILIGWSLYGSLPDAVTYAGTGLIILGGLILWRGQRSAG
jgi:drug/metabolite transporter (DMT)-like permease